MKDNMGNTVTTIRIDKSILDAIKVYSEAEQKSQTDFFNELLSIGLRAYFTERSGGGVMFINNPQFETDKDLKKYETALLKISEAVRVTSCSGLSITPILYNMLAFYSQRLYSDTPRDREQYEKSRTVDSTHAELFGGNRL